MATRRQAYVYGSAVRQPKALPKQQEQQRTLPRERVSTQVKKNRKQALHMNAEYVMFLAVVAVITLVLCIGYISLQTSLASQRSQVATLQEELKEKQSENKTRSDAILNSVNLEQIKARAKELGMVETEQQTDSLAEGADSNYVTQYETIPTNGSSLN